MDQRFRGLVDWLFESAETESAHLMKKATQQSLFALGPTFNKTACKDKWQQPQPGTVQRGVAQTSPCSSVQPVLCPMCACHGQVPLCWLQSRLRASQCSLCSDKCQLLSPTVLAWVPNQTWMQHVEDWAAAVPLPWATSSPDVSRSQEWEG